MTDRARRVWRIGLATCCVLLLLSLLSLTYSLIDTPEPVPVAPVRHLIETYEQYPAGIGETWIVVVWWNDGEIREYMCKTTEGVENMRRLLE